MAPANKKNNKKILGYTQEFFSIKEIQITVAYEHLLGKKHTASCKSIDYAGIEQLSIYGFDEVAVLSGQGGLAVFLDYFQGSVASPSCNVVLVAFSLCTRSLGECSAIHSLPVLFFFF